MNSRTALSGGGGRCRAELDEQGKAAQLSGLEPLGSGGPVALGGDADRDIRRWEVLNGPEAIRIPWPAVKEAEFMAEASCSNACAGDGLVGPAVQYPHLQPPWGFSDHSYRLIRAEMAHSDVGNGVER